MSDSADNDYAVVVENLEKRFGGFVAVDRISFQVSRGEIFQSSPAKNSAM